MKKLIAFILCAAALLALAACGASSDLPAAPEPTAAASTAEPSPVPAAVETAAPTEIPDTAPAPDAAKKAKPEPAAEPEPATESETEAAAVDGLRPDFKRAMDSYEAFYAEYCEFMAQYKANPSDMNLLMQYSRLLQESVEMNDAFEKWNSEDLTNEELKYYLEVNSRVLQMLAQVMQ